MKAVIFDCFGTLFYDSYGLTPFLRLKKLLKRFNRENFRKFAKEVILGYPLEKVLENFLKKEGKIEVYWEALKVMKESKALPYKETFEVLEKIREKGVKTALISNTYKESFEPLLEKYPLKNYFDAMVLSYKVKLVKPLPEIFRLALEKLNVSKKEALFVGDEVKNDYFGAKKAGLRAILIDREGKHKNIAERIKNLKEILKFL